jgi:hypothetical protein
LAVFDVVNGVIIVEGSNFIIEITRSKVHENVLYNQVEEVSDQFKLDLVSVVAKMQEF